MNWETILSFGDSITIGSRTYLGYPEYACHLLRHSTKKEWNALNFSKSGITTVELHRMIAADLFYLSQLKPQVITVMIGTNDAKQGTSVEAFCIAFRQVLLKARLVAPNSLLLLIAIPMLQDGASLPYRPSMNTIIQDYNRAIETMAADFAVEMLTPEVDACHFTDGVHLNDLGIKKISRQLAQFILEKRKLSLIAEAP